MRVTGKPHTGTLVFPTDQFPTRRGGREGEEEEEENEEEGKGSWKGEEVRVKGKRGQGVRKTTTVRGTLSPLPG